MIESGGRILDWIALVLMFFIFVASVYGLIAVHDIPYEIAKRRKHPHVEAIHAAGIVSLFLMHTIWPFLWIWAYLFSSKPQQEADLQESSSPPKRLKSNRHHMWSRIETLLHKIKHPKRRRKKTEQSNKGENF